MANCAAVHAHHNHIPPEAGAWMAQVLIKEWESRGTRWEGRHVDEPHLSARLLQMEGLSSLLKSELELIWREMEQLDCFARKKRSLKSPRGRRKEEMIVILRQFFFTDASGVVVDKEAMIHLTHKTMLLAACRRTPQSLPQHQQQQQQQQQQHVAFGTQQSPASVRMMSPAKIHHVSSPMMVDPMFVPSPFMDAGFRAHFSKMYPNLRFPTIPGNLHSSPDQGNKQPSPSRVVTSVPNFVHHQQQQQRAKVKQELEPVEDESVPRNDEEVRLLRELEQTGFTDKQEILNAIRRLKFKKNHQVLDTDTVMFDLITQREEVDEARKMDQARIESERLRKEEAAHRRKTIAEDKELQLQTSSLAEWKSNEDYFPHSWILANNLVFQTLQGAIAQPGSDAKDQLLRLLKLERDSRKWYKNDLPRAYFSAVVNTKILAVASHRDSGVRDCLEQETARLGNALWSREEQQGDVPRLFIQAHDKHAASLVDHTNRNMDDDDDEVVVVVVAPDSCRPSKPKRPDLPGQRSRAKKRQKTTHHPSYTATKNIQKPPVIEIID